MHDAGRSTTAVSLRDPRLACCLAWLLVLAIGASGRVASAQTRRLPQVTGVVMDATGAVLPGSAVDLIRGGRVVQTSTTDGTGTFTFAQVAAGRYDVRTTHGGFQPRTTAVRVGPRAPAPLQITLSLAGVHQEITVTNDVQVATAAASNANAVTLDQNAIESLPVFDDDVVGSLSRFLDSGALGTGGVTILVNGMEVNGLNVGSAAIQQIAINQDPYSAIYSRPGRGRIEVITKPGSQEYHGDADLVFRDARLNARNAFADVRPPEQRRIGDAFLGGPVGHGGATSFMLSVKDDSEDRQAIVYALGPNGEIRGSAAQPLRHVLASIGVTHQHGRSTISVRPSYEQETDAGRGAGGTTLASAGTTLLPPRERPDLRPADRLRLGSRQSVSDPGRTGAGADDERLFRAWPGGQRCVHRRRCPGRRSTHGAPLPAGGEPDGRQGSPSAPVRVPGARLEPARLQRPERVRRDVLLLEPRCLQGRPALCLHPADGQRPRRLAREGPGAST